MWKKEGGGQKSRKFCVRTKWKPPYFKYIKHWMVLRRCRNLQIAIPSQCEPSRTSFRMCPLCWCCRNIRRCSRHSTSDTRHSWQGRNSMRWGYWFQIYKRGVASILILIFRLAIQWHIKLTFLVCKRVSFGMLLPADIVRDCRSAKKRWRPFLEFLSHRRVII